ncbi:MAG: hypothetical protein JNL32_12400 [Candidatus Kapabacteria bacterium]|nr:hypothetical protein [Candidatus Kapabacteria bacterium]
MLRIPIQGLGDGNYPFDIQSGAADVEGLYPEYSGDVRVTGELSKIGKRVTLSAVATASAVLVCDYSLNEFTEEITAPIAMSFVFDTGLYLLRRDEQHDDTYEVHVLREDETYLDITLEVAQELSVLLPLKRVSPEYRNKEAKDIINDEHLLRDTETTPMTDDDRWSALKSINFKN